MKDIMILIRQRKAFYLTVLILTLLLTIVGAFYNLSVARKTMGVMPDASIKTEMESQVERVLEKNPVVFQTGMSSAGLMNGFLHNYTYMGFVGISFVILAVIIFSYFNMSDKETKEFLETLPVKRVALEVYNYVALIGITVLNILVTTVIHLLYMGNVNRQIADLAERFPQLLGNVVPADLVAANTASLLYQFSMMALFLLAMTTFWYACSALFKKWAAGLTVGVILWYSLAGWVYDIRDIIHGLTYDMDITELYRRIAAPFDVPMYFDRFVWNGAKCSNPNTTYVAIVLVVMLIVMIGIMILHAYVRELSGGKLFYVNTLNVVFLLLGGIWLYSGSIDYLGWGGSGPVIAAFITVIGEVIAIYLLYHKKDKVYKLAVKEKKIVNNPVLAQGLKSYMIATGIIVLLTEYIDIGTNLEWIRREISDWYSSYRVNDWVLNFYGMEWRYEFAMFIIAGFIIFKCIQFAMERTKASREFYETLPVSKAKIYCTKLLMDLGIIIIPLTIFTAVSVGYLLRFRPALKLYYNIPVADFNACIGEQFLLMGIMLCIAIFFLGVMYLIDAVTVSGGMKNIFCGVVALSGVIAFVLILELEIPLLQDFAAVLDGVLNPIAVIVYLFLGILLLIFAGNRYIHRDKAKEIFYYKWVKYVFATLLSLCYLFFVLGSAVLEQSPIQYLLATVGTALIFFVIIYYCTPGKMAELRKRFAPKTGNRV